MSPWILTFILIICITNVSNAVFLKSIFENWYQHCEDGTGMCQLSMTCWMNGGTAKGTNSFKNVNKQLSFFSKVLVEV